MIPKSFRVKPSSLFEEVFLHSWWVVLFSLLCLMFYEQGQKHRLVFFEELREKLKELNDERESSLKLKKELMLNINSQSDPAFVELTLMKVLGVISEGQVKVYFCEEKSMDEGSFYSNIANIPTAQVNLHH